ncbi:MAG TPA: glycosyltransferase family 9 protein [Chthoniobacterales bacterium]|jgi:ADP-heptose:LPS heptosyltransferase|nr:glycosyltransferase family 9 protein [Chthoniobacterales bacterium]
MDLPVGISALQHTDRWLGAPLCAVLTLVRKVFGPGRPSRACPVHKILFIKFAEQGSTVLAYPAICRATEMVGRENVYFVVFEDNRFILDVMEIIPEQNVITISTKSPFALATGAFRAILRARKIDIDAVIDMEFLTRFSAMLTFLTGAKSRVGFHTFFGDGPYRGDLMTHRLLYNPHLHTSQMFEAMVEALTRDPAVLPTFDFKPPATQPFAKFNPAPGEAAEVDALLRRENPAVGSAPLILLNPNASDLLPLRRWPPMRYVELSRRLLERYPDLFIAFTGAPAEATANNRLAAEVSSNRVISLAGKTTLRQVLVLYTRSQILVTNDSGPAHFASMTPIHVITLFGPETPALFGARSSNATALWAGIACSPCVNAYNNRQSVCRNNLCMQTITVDAVFEKVTSIYDSLKAGDANAAREKWSRM